MAELLTCAQGHTWEKPQLGQGERILCPVCGLDLATTVDKQAEGLPTVAAPADPEAAVARERPPGPPMPGPSVAADTSAGAGARLSASGAWVDSPLGAGGRRGRFRIVRPHPAAGWAR